VLTLTDYERAGGIDGAVADSAQRAYERLTPGQQGAARQVFTRLTATTTDGLDTIIRADRADLTAGKDDALTRLVVSPRALSEVRRSGDYAGGRASFADPTGEREWCGALAHSDRLGDQVLVVVIGW
jgi:hypothetical protein